MIDLQKAATLMRYIILKVVILWSFRDRMDVKINAYQVAEWNYISIRRKLFYKDHEISEKL